MQKNEDTNKSMEDKIESAIHYDNRIMEPIAELFISNFTSHFRLRVKPNSVKEMFINSNTPVASHGSSLIFSIVVKSSS